MLNKIVLLPPRPHKSRGMLRGARSRRQRRRAVVFAGWRQRYVYLFPAVIHGLGDTC